MWHRIDYDALWASDKLARCSDEAQADYAWIYGIADAWGCFELTNLRVVYGRVAAIRTNLPLERLEQDFSEYHTHGLCFTWREAGKRYGFWTGCESRLPPMSVRNRYTRSTPEPPKEQFDRYVCSFGGSVPQPVELHPQGERSAQPQSVSQPREVSLDMVATGSRLHRDNSNETETGTEQEHTHSALDPQPLEPTKESQGKPEQLELGQSREEKPRARVLLEIYEQERGPLPAVRDETPERLSKCRRRLLSHGKSQEQFLADFRAAVRKASQIPWPQWRPGFDWFIENDTHYLKVLEGVYDNWGNNPTRSGTAHLDEEIMRVAATAGRRPN
jgi:hypothetical protein